jgi:hypothetical protein
MLTNSSGDLRLVSYAVKAAASRRTPNYLEKSMCEGVRFWRLQSSR